MKKIITITYLIFLLSIGSYQAHAAEKTELLKIDWSFKGLFGKFDRGSLQRGYQVYSEVCAGCHSMKYLSYRNLSEKGGPEFSVEQAKAIAASFEITDYPLIKKLAKTNKTLIISTGLASLKEIEFTYN